MKKRDHSENLDVDGKIMDLREIWLEVVDWMHLN
jgi:hypothetical protein